MQIIPSAIQTDMGSGGGGGVMAKLKQYETQNKFELRTGRNA